MQAWQLQDAKNRFSEVIRESRREPQLITLRGKDEAVVLSCDEYRKLARPKKTWAELLGDAPPEARKLEISRGRDTGRSIDL
jgi:prevent-host-death family protein